jgi:DNA-binding response OmpR family regulator
MTGLLLRVLISPLVSQMHSGRREPVRLLAITPYSADHHQLRKIAAIAEWDLSIVETLSAARSYLSGAPVAVVLFDHDLLGVDWRTALRELLETSCPKVVIMASAFTPHGLREEVFRSGGFDILSKPLDLAEVVPVINDAWSLLGNLHQLFPFS